jgi:chorismate mutase
MSNSIINIKVMPRFENFRVNGKDDSTIFFFFREYIQRSKRKQQKDLSQY